MTKTYRITIQIDEFEDGFEMIFAHVWTGKYDETQIEQIFLTLQNTVETIR